MKKHVKNPNWPELFDDIATNYKKSKARKKRKHGEKPNWLQLPYDVTINILRRLGAVQILVNVQKVCTEWHTICKDPALWSVINMYVDEPKFKDMGRDLNRICMDAVDRSQGKLVHVCIDFFGNPQLLQYIGQRSSELSLLQLVYCHYNIPQDIWSNFFKKVPLLKELSISFCEVLAETLVHASRHCLMLTTIKIRVYAYSIYPCLDDVLATAMGMTQLRHLQLSGYAIYRRHLEAIISSGCTHLETLDLTHCFSGNDIISLSLREKCIAQIQDTRFPADWMEKFKKDDDFCDMVQD